MLFDPHSAGKLTLLLLIWRSLWLEAFDFTLALGTEILELLQLLRLGSLPVCV